MIKSHVWHVTNGVCLCGGMMWCDVMPIPWKRILSARKFKLFGTLHASQRARTHVYPLHINNLSLNTCDKWRREGSQHEIHGTSGAGSTRGDGEGEWRMWITAYGLDMVLGSSQSVHSAKFKHLKCQLSRPLCRVLWVCVCVFGILSNFPIKMHWTYDKVCCFCCCGCCVIACCAEDKQH